MESQPIVAPADRLAELEATLQQREEKIKELTAECDEAQELVDRLRDEAEANMEMIEQWAEVFEMQQDDRGVWIFDPTQSKLWEDHLALLGEHQKLIRQWNKFVGEYNRQVAPRERGRPLAASAAQQADVLKRRKAGASLRAIAKAMSLSLQSVRTIVDKTQIKDRTAKRANVVRRMQFDRLRAAGFRARKAARDRLPEAIDERLKTDAALVKAAKGLGTAPTRR
jgi:DNA-binding CsgD family transcriptional regulator